MTFLKDNLFSIILICLCIKGMMVGFFLPESIVLLGLLAAICVKHAFIDSKIVTKDDQMVIDIKELHNKIESISSSVSALKIERGFKRNGGINEEKRNVDINSENVQDRTFDIHQIATTGPDLKTSYLKLEAKCDALSKTINDLLLQLEQKENEIVELKNGGQQNVAVVEIMNDDEIIAEMQLNRLKETARARQLTLDEIRMFDLLVKNKRLLQGKTTSMDGKGESIKNLGQTDLIKLASRKIEEK